jgi:CheY-like chemotaxis protein
VLSYREYDYFFVSYELYREHEEFINNHVNNTKIVIITEFGESVPDTGRNVITMPIYCVAIANIINNVYDSFSYDASKKLSVQFAAPEARVLVVDDIATNRRVIQGLLAPYNMQVDVCMNGLAAIDMVKSNVYDMLLMDHRMPVMDGIEATRHIREMGSEDPYYNNVAIIALTANAIEGTRELFLENGFNDFLSKPIDTVLLNTILVKWIPKDKHEPLSSVSETLVAFDESTCNKC